MLRGEASSLGEAITPDGMAWVAWPRKAAGHVSDLSDNVELFGLSPGSVNLFAATYNVFGNMVKSQYPELLPAFEPAAEVVDPSYVQELAAAAQKASP